MAVVESTLQIASGTARRHAICEAAVSCVTSMPQLQHACTVDRRYTDPPLCSRNNISIYLAVCRLGRIYLRRMQRTTSLRLLCVTQPLRHGSTPAAGDRAAAADAGRPVERRRRPSYVRDEDGTNCRRRQRASFSSLAVRRDKKGPDVKSSR